MLAQKARNVAQRMNRSTMQRQEVSPNKSSLRYDVANDTALSDSGNCGAPGPRSQDPDEAEGAATWAQYISTLHHSILLRIPKPNLKLIARRRNSCLQLLRIDDMIFQGKQSDEEIRRHFENNRKMVEVRLIVRPQLAAVITQPSSPGTQDMQANVTDAEGLLTAHERRLLAYVVSPPKKGGPSYTPKK